MLHFAPLQVCATLEKYPEISAALKRRLTENILKNYGLAGAYSLLYLLVATLFTFHLQFSFTGKIYIEGRCYNSTFTLQFFKVR